VGLQQGDQIGRIFAYWAIVYFGQFFENKRTIPPLPKDNFFPLGKSYVLILPKNEFGYILGNFIQTDLVTMPASPN
jgi:hypothetical protein